MTTTPEKRLRRHLTGLIGAVDNGNVTIQSAVNEIVGRYAIFDRTGPAVTVLTQHIDEVRTDRFLGASKVAFGDNGELYVRNPDDDLAALYAPGRWDVAVDSTYTLTDDDVADKPLSQNGESV